MRQVRFISPRLGTVMGLVFLLVGIGVALGWRHLRNEEALLGDDSLVRQALPSVEKDLLGLDEVPLLVQAARLEGVTNLERDGGLWISQALSWHQGESPRSQSLELPLGLRYQLESWGGTWLSHLGDMPLTGVDFAWMDGLRQFEYWQMVPPSSMGDQTSRGETARGPSDPSYEALPDIGLISAWIKLRLAKVYQNPDDTQGLSQVMDLVRLALTAQRWDLIQAAWTWQGWVHDWIEEALRSGRVLTGPDHLMSRREIEQAQRALPALTAYIDWAVGADVADRIFPPGVSRLGACAALRQRLPAIRWQAQIMDPESREAEVPVYRLVERLKSSCRFAQVDGSWQKYDQSSPLFLGVATEREDFLVRFPSLRKAMILTLLGMIRPQSVLEPYLDMTGF